MGCGEQHAPLAKEVKTETKWFIRANFRANKWAVEECALPRRKRGQDRVQRRPAEGARLLQKLTNCCKLIMFLFFLLGCGGAVKEAKTESAPKISKIKS